MKKQITFLFLTIFLISLISAIDLTAGECSTIDFPNEDGVSIEIIGNSSNMEGFSWNKNGTIIEYCFDLNYQPDNFTIRWFNEEEVYVEEPQQGGGGSRWSSRPIIAKEEINDTNDTNVEDNNIETSDDVVDTPLVPEDKKIPRVIQVLFVLFVAFILYKIVKFIGNKIIERGLKNYE